MWGWGTNPKDLRPVELVNKFKSVLIKGTWAQGQGTQVACHTTGRASISAVRRDGRTHASLEVAGPRSTFGCLTPVLTSGSPHFLMPLFYPAIKSLGPNDTAQGMGDNGEDAMPQKASLCCMPLLRWVTRKYFAFTLDFDPEDQKCTFRQTWQVRELERIGEPSFQS